MGLHKGGSGGDGGGGGSDDGGIRGEEIVEHEVDVDVEVAAGRRDAVDSCCACLVCCACDRLLDWRIRT